MCGKIVLCILQQKADICVVKFCSVFYSRYLCVVKIVLTCAHRIEFLEPIECVCCQYTITLRFPEHNTLF